MSLHKFVRHKRFKWKSTRDSQEFDEWIVLNRFKVEEKDYVELRNIKSGLKDTKAHELLVKALFDGYIKFEIKGNAAAELNEGETFSTRYNIEVPDDIEPHEWAQAKIRLKAILPLLSIKRTKKSYQDRLDDIKNAVYDVNNDDWTDEEFKLLKVKSARSLARFVSTFIKSDGNLRSLVPNYKNCGAPGINRINSDAQVYEAIDAFSPNAKAREILGETELLVDEFNDANQSASPLKAPSLRTVQRRASRIQYERRTAQYFGSVRMLIDSKQHGVFEELRYPRQRIELDGTKSDLIVVNDDGEPIGRLTFIIAIDVKTRVIVGYYLGFEPESWQSVSDALYDVIGIKESPITRWGTTNEIKKLYGVPYAGMGASLTCKCWQTQYIARADEI